MKIRKRLFFLLVPAFFFLGLALTAGFFFTRPPALVLSDLSFDLLYGPSRGFLRQAELSLRLFRPVKKVTIAENAGFDAVIFAIEEASSRPWAVLAPYRYAQGLRSYAGEHPETPALIVGGRENRREGRLLSLGVDTRLDSYRAGRAAAVLSREKTGEILVFQDEQNFPVNRDAFLAGLRAEGCQISPLYLIGHAEYSGYDNLSCVVLGSNAPDFWNRNTAIPVILFSWVDPAFSPKNVKLLFDDSPWGLSEAAFRAVREEGEAVPSDILLPAGRIEDRELLEKIKTVVKEGFIQ
jgi:hypothetical protein